MNEVKWTNKAAKNLLKIDAKYHAQIKAKIEELKQYPNNEIPLDVIILKGQRSDIRRLRVGDYRIIFEIIDGVPKIIEIQAVLRRTSQTYN